MLAFIGVKVMGKKSGRRNTLSGRTALYVAPAWTLWRDLWRLFSEWMAYVAKFELVGPLFLTSVGKDFIVRPPWCSSTVSDGIGTAPALP